MSATAKTGRRLPALLRTSAVRFAALYTVLFCIAMGLGLGAVYLGTITLVERQRTETISGEIRALSEGFRQGGVARLVRAVDDRSGPDARGDNVYLVTAPTLRPLAGNLSAWPDAEPDGDWVSFPVQKRDGERLVDRQVRARVFHLPGGFRLLVGRISEDLLDFRRRFLQVSLWVAAGTIVLGLLTGLIFGRRVLRRVAVAAAAGERIAAGNLDSRVPIQGKGDEFDRLAGSVNAMLDRIEALMQGMRMATDSISHDVRRPLTRLRAELDLALRRELPEAEARAAMGRALEEIDGTVAILENLLKIARAEAGVPSGDWEEFDLGALAADAADLYQPLAEARGVRLSTDLAPMPFRGERQLMAQAVGNLIDNAVKFAPAGEGAVTVALSGEGEAAVLTVTDNGPGIPAADRARVTDRFVRLDAARADEGSGLGLSLVHAVARMHGGALELGDNAPGLAARLLLPRGA